jgi:ABC-type glycerol-3-phosphate transport system substrate-binding protein
LVASGLMILLGAGTGCQRGPAEPAVREIRSIHMTGVYADAARVLAAEFQRQTGLRVTVVDAPYLSLREKELTDVLLGAGAFDVLQVAHQWEGEILPHLLPLDDFVARQGPDLADFIPAVRQHSGRWNGRIYALPMACDVITLLYRRDVFAERSAAFQAQTGRPLEPPRTWDEYLEMVRFLHSPSLYGNVIMGLPEQNFTVWAGIFHGLGGQLVDAQWQPQLDSEVGVRSLELFVEMFRYAPPGSERLGFTEANALFLQGKGAMYLTWPSLIWAQLKDTNLCRFPEHIGAAVIPGRRPQLSAWSLGINRACAVPEAAYRWIEFFVNAPNTRRLLLEWGKGSPRQSIYEDPECRRVIPYLDQILAGFPGNQPRFRIPPSQELTDYLDQQIAEAIRGRITPQAALERAAARWREILAETGYRRD